MADDLDLAATRAATGAVPEGPDHGILAPYQGVRPAAPAWAEAALAVEPETALVDVAGARVEMLAWGPRGAPGIVLLHGNGAHARWWSFIAPLLAAEGWRVAAPSWSGMGGSDWRERYSMALFQAEMEACAEWAGLTGASRRPVLAGHSFGGFPALVGYAANPGYWHSLITLDSCIEPPEMAWEGPPRPKSGNRVYERFDEALARFRLAPPQPCANHWALDWIARHSLKTVEGGFTWRFDPDMWYRFDRIDEREAARTASGPMHVVRGGESVLMQAPTWDYMRGLFTPSTRFSTIPGARHHVMLDQPLAVATLLLAALA